MHDIWLAIIHAVTLDPVSFTVGVIVAVTVMVGFIICWRE